MKESPFAGSYPLVPDYSLDLIRIASGVKLLNQRVQILMVLTSACLGCLVTLVLR